MNKFILHFIISILSLNEVLAKNVEAEKVVDHLSDTTRKTMLMLDKSIQNQLLLDRDPHGNVQVPPDGVSVCKA